LKVNIRICIKLYDGGFTSYCIYIVVHRDREEGDEIDIKELPPYIKAISGINPRKSHVR
jgi:hypothetical protein